MSGSPERGTQRKAPLRQFIRRNLDLNHSYGNVVTFRHDAEAHVLSACAPLLAPGDEFLKPLDARWRRRNELRDFFCREQGKERWRVSQSQLAHRDSPAMEDGQLLSPVRRCDGKTTHEGRQRADVYNGVVEPVDKRHGDHVLSGSLNG